MTTFKYKGLSSEGVELNGVIRAHDELEAVSKLRESCSIITKIEPFADKDTRADRNFKIKDKELAIICSQFAIILSAGIPIVQSVEMVAEQAVDNELRERMFRVAEDISSGHTMAQSFEDNMPKLPRTFIETIRAGEVSGSLVDCFRRLNVYYDKSAKLQAKVIGALTYPLIVIFVAIIVFIIIMTVAVPLFKSTFADLGIELPFMTRLVIGISDFFTSGWWIILGLAALIGFVYLLVRRTDEGKRRLASYSLNRAPFHKIRLMKCSNQFASTMSTMIAAGLPIIRSLEVTSNVIQNYVYSVSVYQVKENVEQGRSLSDSMREKPCFPKLLTEMCGVGENSGSMEETLDVIADFYANEVQLATDRLLAVMEPVITIGLAAMTVILLLSVYLPMFTMYGSVI